MLGLSVLNTDLLGIHYCLCERRTDYMRWSLSHRPVHPIDQSNAIGISEWNVLSPIPVSLKVICTMGLEHDAGMLSSFMRDIYTNHNVLHTNLARILPECGCTLGIC